MAAVYRRERPARCARRPRVEVKRSPRGLLLSVDGTFASWYAPGSPATGTVWEALASPLLLLPPRRRRSLLILGLGAGSTARVARALAPGARIVGVERELEVLRAARRCFDLDELGLEIVQGDALAYLQRTRRRFDAVFEDVFVGRARAVRKPEWLPHPGLPLAARRVAPGGILVSNALDEAPAVAHTLGALYPTLMRIDVRDYDNRILVGAPRRQSARALRAAVVRDPVLAPAAAHFSFRTLSRRRSDSGRRSSEALGRRGGGGRA